MPNVITWPSMSYEHHANLPDISAVYAVLCDDEVLYVGSAINLRKRWLNHHRARLIAPLSNTVIVWQITDRQLLRETETKYIKLLKPAWNQKYVKPVCVAHRFGEVIRCHRRLEGLSTRSLALQIGISQGVLSRIEHGRSMDSSTMAKVLAWLFANDDGKPKRK